MMDWERIIETAIAAFMGAGAVVFIDGIVKYYLYKKKNFQEAISIQLALHQMLVVCLKIQEFYTNKKEYFIKIYSQEKFDKPEQVWLNFRHIDLPPYMHIFHISLDWDFTQFLSRRENKIRNTLKDLLPAKSSYESLIFIIKERNELLWFVHQIIEQIRNTNGNGIVNNFEYIKDNLTKVIGLPRNKKLKGITDKYIETIDSTIIDCNKAFNILSTYISESFPCSTPLTLNIPNNLKKLLDEVVSSNDKKPNNEFNSK
jgi:hypothetical protein